MIPAANLLIERLRTVEARYEELNQLMAEPEVVSDNKRYQKTAKAHSEIGEIVSKFREYKDLERGVSETGAMVREETDPELKAMAEEELANLQKRLAQCETDLKLLLLPKDPNDDRNVILEIRAGTGGDEATLFAADVFRMYSRYAEQQRWRVEILSSNATGVGGFKEIIALIEGKGVYSRLKYESGVHRVQRVPATEASGRIHTSAITVAVLPEADEVEVAISEKDLRVDTFCSSGPGGQSVNTTDSAVRITHIPTGTVVSCQNEKSQLQNKASAMVILKAKLLALKKAEERAHLDALRGDVAGSWGDQMRSYVLHPYQMVKDLRTQYESGNTSGVFDGEIDEFIEAGVRWRRTGQTVAEQN